MVVLLGRQPDLVDVLVVHFEVVAVDDDHFAQLVREVLAVDLVESEARRQVHRASDARFDLVFEGVDQLLVVQVADALDRLEYVVAVQVVADVHHFVVHLDQSPLQVSEVDHLPLAPRPPSSWSR